MTEAKPGAIFSFDFVVLYFKVPHETLCAIQFHLYNLKNVRNTHGEVLLLVKLQSEICNASKSSTPPWVFFTFFNLYKSYKTVQSITHGKIRVFTSTGEYGSSRVNQKELEVVSFSSKQPFADVFENRCA